jgi:hypothetical protein
MHITGATHYRTALVFAFVGACADSGATDDERRSAPSGPTSGTTVECGDVIPETEVDDLVLNLTTASGPFASSTCDRWVLQGDLAASHDVFNRGKDTFHFVNDGLEPLRLRAHVSMNADEDGCDEALGWTLLSAFDAEGQHLHQELDCQSVTVDVDPGASIFLLVENNVLAELVAYYLVAEFQEPEPPTDSECASAGTLGALHLPVNAISDTAYPMWPSPQDFAGTIVLPKAATSVTTIEAVDILPAMGTVTVESVDATGDAFVISVSGRTSDAESSVAAVAVSINEGAVEMIGTVIRGSGTLQVDPSSTARHLLLARRARHLMPFNGYLDHADPFFENPTPGAYGAQSDATVDALVPDLVTTLVDERLLETTPIVYQEDNHWSLQWTLNPESPAFVVLDTYFEDPTLGALTFPDGLFVGRVNTVVVPETSIGSQLTLWQASIGPIYARWPAPGTYSFIWRELEAGQRVFAGYGFDEGESPFSDVLTAQTHEATLPTAPEFSTTFTSTTAQVRASAPAGDYVVFVDGSDFVAACQIGTSGAASFTIEPPSDAVAMYLGAYVIDGGTLAVGPTSPGVLWWIGH